MVLDETAPLTISIRSDQADVVIPQLFYNESSKWPICLNIYSTIYVASPVKINL